MSSSAFSGSSDGGGLSGVSGLPIDSGSPEPSGSFGSANPSSSAWSSGEPASSGSSAPSGSSISSGSSGVSPSSGSAGTGGSSGNGGSSIGSGSGSSVGSGLGSGDLSHTSIYDISPIELGELAGYHGGTGSFARSQLVIDPASVPGTQQLSFFTADVHVTTKLFQISQNVIPNWYGVAIPDNVSDFSKPNIFFHPIPGQDGYVDADYPTKSGKWPQLFYYMELLGYELDGAIGQFGAPSDQIIIMPFLTSSATDTSIFAPNWFGIVTDILTDISRMAGQTGTVDISEVVVSSFSVGYVYSENFRWKAPGITPLLKQIWDFDGYPKIDSSKLLSTASCAAIKYDQLNEPGCIHVPLSRWAGYPKNPPNPADTDPPVNGNDVHRCIRNFLFLDAATKRNTSGI
jgi:hypothetical protein